MNEWVQTVILGVLQGITEFLPISSSGHLVIAEHLLNVETPGTFFEVMLHAGTLISILLYFGRDLIALVVGLFRRESKACHDAFCLLVSTIPAGLVYYFLSSKIEQSFDHPIFSVAMLGVTGLVLISVRFARERKRSVTLPRALVVGIAQAFALLPGISRSGSTICTARHLGVDPQEAAEFSLLMSVPLLVAATGLSLIRLARSEGPSMLAGMPAGPVLVGTAVAAFVGYFAIAVLVRTLSTGKFWLFGVYCLSMAGMLALTL